MQTSLAGFREIDHAADWALHVWAPTLPGLLEQAARGMLKLAGIRVADSPVRECEFEFTFIDYEQLLVKFLNEILYWIDQENLAFTEYRLSMGTDRLIAHLRGYPICSIDKAIKAVTYHNLEVRQTEQGYEAHLVFDV
ncbi:MAG: archease [Anaerolineales bacterium]|nr:archease [Anaerolineales bacterium]MCS7248983.1 archease [Anaerolineales bacterium]MDW8162796.1 archease [Anaerolineales bacterium]MDW8448306.1 archease [Anaerolineales bacterium]